MFSIAQDLLQLLDSEGRQRILFPLESEERFNWSYVPKVRHGLIVQAMTLAQRKALHRLLRAALSNAGYLKVTSIMHLEEVLRALENGELVRDPEHYYLTFFGMPSRDGIWGWRIEGHHVSLNFLIGKDGTLTTTPAFLGANPAEVRSGPWSGWRALGAEEDIGRSLLHALDTSQREQAIIAVDAPGDIITRNDRNIRLATFEGLSAADLRPGQRDLLMELFEAYAHNLNRDLAQMHLDRITGAGIDRLYFAWAGSASVGDGHYYRVHGPTTLIEYDNTQNDANHVHTVMRDLEHDWGGDLLAQHYAESEHHHH